MQCISRFFGVLHCPPGTCRQLLALVEAHLASPPGDCVPVRAALGSYQTAKLIGGLAISALAFQAPGLALRPAMKTMVAPQMTVFENGMEQSHHALRMLMKSQH